ncbi:hypothetical protein RJ641_030940 [Dillenia turbinata]|uniref:OTU domain-containing protein n=1 Tax=Dillenia turbinata TaxID=194707 RepID=A0AAN8VX73_9MAGN
MVQSLESIYISGPIPKRASSNAYDAGRYKWRHLLKASGAKRCEQRVKQEAAREQRIQEEQSNIVSNRMIENEILENKLEALGLTVTAIKPDGHCLYQAVEDQLALISGESATEDFGNSLAEKFKNYSKEDHSLLWRWERAYKSDGVLAQENPASCCHIISMHLDLATITILWSPD